MMSFWKNKRFRSGVRVTLLALVAAIIGLNVYSMSAASIAGNAVPMPFGVGASVVLSGSMEPKLSAGDLIFIVEKDEYHPDEIVVFQEGSIAVAHRILSISEEEVITQGDANNSEDAPFHPKYIKGKVVFAIPYVGYLVYIVKTPLGTLAILGLAIYFWERSFRVQKKINQQKLADIKAEIDKLKEQQEKQ